MAYQTRGRDPLFDTDMAQAIEKRSRELIGLALILAGLLIAAMLYSYSPDDPSFLTSTDRPVNNWLGRSGAAVAALLVILIGVAGWALTLVLVTWGLRFALHRGAARALERLILAPIWIALVAMHAATMVPGAGWAQSFGLGGYFGDMALGMLLSLLPLGAALALKLLSLVSVAAVLVFGAYVLGFDRVELARLRRFLWLGLVVSYDALRSLMGRGAGQAIEAAAALRARRAAQIAMVSQGRDAVLTQGGAVPASVVRPSLLGRVPGMVRRVQDSLPTPELVEPGFAADTPAPGDDRIRSRIADAIRARATPPALTAPPAMPVAPPRVTPVIAAIHKAAEARIKGQRPLLLEPARSEPVTRAEPMLRRTAVVAPYPQDVPDHTRFVDVPAIRAADAFMHDDDDLDDDLDAFDEPPAPLRAAIPRLSIPTAEPRRAVVQHGMKKPVQPSARAIAEAQPSLFDAPTSDYELPPLSLLSSPEVIQRHHLSDEALEENARMLETVLDDYGVKGDIVSVRPGPVVTMYELEPAPGLKASRVIGLADDIARSMSALSARVSTVPGRTVIGIELPNEHREKVVLREILAAREFGDTNMKLPLALGKDIGGAPLVANLAKMPHLLIAGTTGSGKSVAINTMILSLLYKLTPEDCRLIMIDPKMLELSVYDGIPHLLSPVVTDPKKAVVALKWVVGEMEERYRKMSKMGVRNIDGYNSRVADALAKSELFSRTVQTGFDEETGEPMFETEEFQPVKMPYIVVIVDEMADLMMVAGKEIEACIQRLAQMARASGIHLIMATQRPSVDVITGTIKANFPTRISFQVTSKIDSRTILGEMGAEQLLGMGDMLYMAGGAKIIRCHGPFVSDEEVEEIVNHLKAFGPPTYMNAVVEGPDEDREADIDAVLGLTSGGNTDVEDALYDTAVAIVVKDRKCSTSYIQRKLGIGYNKAAKLVEQMEEQGVVTRANHVGKREILVPEQH
jgi:S-DNA-T family DNA segregation ATPase FtsK/SpoIIIE